MALYRALPSAIDSATRRNVLPLLRLAPGQRVVSGRLADPGRHAQPGTRGAPATLIRRWPKGHPWLPDGVDLAVCALQQQTTPGVAATVGDKMPDAATGGTDLWARCGTDL